jgi:hypothetical protein
MRLTISQAVLRKQPCDCSGAAQAARCIAYTAQCHPNVEPIRNYKVVGSELQTDWVDLTVTGGEHGRNRWLAPMRLTYGQNRWLAPMRLTISLVEPRKRPCDCSGPAQAAQCIAYTAQFHPNVEPIRNYEVVGGVLQAD